MRKGSLTVVGVGYQIAIQTTLEAQYSITNAERLFYLVNDKLTEQWLRSLNRRSVSLAECYVEGRPGMDCGNEMVDRMISVVRRGFRVCAAFAGHPGIMLYAAHEAVRRTREAGLQATMQPGISALDCLYADLGIDPASNGCQVFAATDFLIHQRKFDPCSALILLQTGALGLTKYSSKNDRLPSRLQVLTEVLLDSYPPDHEVVIYDRPSIPFCNPNIQKILLNKLPDADVSFVSTLYLTADGCVSAPLPLRGCPPLQGGQ
jgi:uncharacterized protein YabN with tetrapyrrole methylase and pyrophosphatase domain